MSNKVLDPVCKPIVSVNIEGISLTKREYFAMIAMHGWLCGRKFPLNSDYSSDIAESSISIADKLLNRLEEVR